MLFNIYFYIHFFLYVTKINIFIQILNILSILISINIINIKKIIDYLFKYFQIKVLQFHKKKTFED